MVRHVAVKNLVTSLGQVIPLRMRHVKLLHRELARLELWLDLLDEMQIRPLRFSIVRVAGHRNIAATGFLVQRGGKLAPVQQPFFECASAFGLGDTPFQLVEQRRNLRPIAKVNSRRDERAWFGER